MENTTIKVTFEEVSVVNPTVEEIEVTNAPTEAMDIEEELEVEATVTMSPAGANPVDFTVETSDAETISVEGKTIKALKTGKATITVKAGDKQDSFEVTVK
ncbi:Ig-like domain-containing protein [Tissierellaceae bacterium HCP3S3_D8]